MKYFSPEEMGEQFNIKPATIRKWIRESKLKAVKLGGLWRISEEELQRFVEAGKVEE